MVHRKVTSLNFGVGQKLCYPSPYYATLIPPAYETVASRRPPLLESFGSDESSQVNNPFGVGPLVVVPGNDLGQGPIDDHG